MATSPEPAATTVAGMLAVLFGRYGSRELLETEEVAVIVVGTLVPAFTFIVIGRENDAPEASVLPLQEIVPVPPTAGVMHVQPAGGTPMLWNVSFAGTVIENVGTLAVKLPRFETTFV